MALVRLLPSAEHLNHFWLCVHEELPAEERLPPVRHTGCGRPTASTPRQRIRWLQSPASAVISPPGYARKQVTFFLNCVEQVFVRYSRSVEALFRLVVPLSPTYVGNEK